MVIGKRLVLCAILATVGAGSAGCALLRPAQERDRVAERMEHLRRLVAGSQGVLGACIADKAGMACVNGGRRMPTQNVTALLVSIAVFDAADRGIVGLEDEVLVRNEDLSGSGHPIAQVVGERGYRTTVRDLIWRAVVQSDAAAVDILAAKVGGPKAVQAVLNRKGLTGVRFDRDEKHVQSDVMGLAWKRDYAFEENFQAAVAAVPKERRDAAYAAYRVDPRDTATAKGMARLLSRLAAGDLLSPDSTRIFMETMTETATFPGRLRAGTPPGWSIAHKTGTSNNWDGLSAATNDVGIMTSQAGEKIAVAVFLADSPASDEERDRTIADVARIAAERY